MIAIIGSGVSGAICARELRKAGREVAVFDKGRGPGGRAATRRAPTGTRFDHGAQYFTARTDEFQAQVADWVERGVVAAWEGRFADVVGGSATPKSDESAIRYVGTPAMNAIVKDLTAEGDFQYGVRVGSIRGEPGAWSLTDAKGQSLGVFESVIVSAPAPQAADLLRPVAPDMAATAAATPMSGCWAVLTAFHESLELPFDGAYITDSPLAWAARDSSKPGRDAEGETWTLHGSPEWSEEHIEADAVEVAGRLLGAFFSAAGVEATSPREAWAHRWRFALPPSPLEQEYLFDSELSVGACGDWCGGPRVEGAWLSGRALAARLLA